MLGFASGCHVLHTCRGIHPSEAMISVACFRLPPISEKDVRLPGKFSQLYLFPTNFRFSSAKISDDLFLVINYKFILNFPFPPIFRYFSAFPLFREKFSFPCFCKCPSDFVKFMCFVHTLRVFRFPPSLTMMHLCIRQCTY